MKLATAGSVGVAIPSFPSPLAGHSSPCGGAGVRAPLPRTERPLRRRPRELDTFLAEARWRGQPVPRFIEQELRDYLRCGVLAFGFLRVHCDACGLDRLVPFSCKRRGFCPSCGGRRMADTAAHLVDCVLPEVPVRQWVLTLPYPLRYRCAYDARLTSAVLRAFLRALFAELRRRARQQGSTPRGQCGAVTFIQPFGYALNANLHFHTLVLDGVYASIERPPTRFLPLPPPSRHEVARVLAGTARRITRGVAHVVAEPCCSRIQLAEDVGELMLSKDRVLGPRPRLTGLAPQRDGVALVHPLEESADVLGLHYRWCLRFRAFAARRGGQEKREPCGGACGRGAP